MNKSKTCLDSNFSAGLLISTPEINIPPFNHPRSKRLAIASVNSCTSRPNLSHANFSMDGNGPS